MDGRLAVLAIMGELKTHNCPDELMHMACKRLFGKDYRFNETADALKHIKPIPPKCETLRSQLHVECDGCVWKPKNPQLEVIITPQNPSSEVIVIDPTQYTHAGNADWFIRLHGQNVRYVRDWKCWMIWNGKIWEYFESDEITQLVVELTREMNRQADYITDSTAANLLRKHAKATQSLANMLATIKTAKNDPKIQAKPDDFDSNKYLINYANGTLNLKSGQIQPYNRDDLMTKCSRIPFIQQPIPVFLKFLDEIFEGKQEIIKYIQTLFGMCMTGDVSQEQLFIFWGSTANNGKGTLVEAISYILDEYRVALPVSSLAAHTRSAIPNDIAMLKGARLCTVNEPRDNEPLDAGTIKSITDKGQISARFLGKEFFKFWQTHHTIITTNPKPNIKMDAGMKRRLVLIPFYFSPVVVDLNLDKKLQAEAPGIIAWMLEGCLRWQKDGDLIQPQEIKDAVAEYHEEMDHLSEFWHVCIEVDIAHAKTPTNIIYAIYKLWCEANEIRAQSPKNFTQTVLHKGIKGLKKDFGYNINKVRCRSYIGIRGTMRATEIALRYMANPGTEKEWAVEQFQQWESWKPATATEKIMRNEGTQEIIKSIQDRFGTDATREEVDEFIKAWDEDVSDDDRDQIVTAFFSPQPQASGQAQRDRIKSLRDILLEEQNLNGAAQIDAIVFKASSIGMNKEIVIDMVNKLKSSGEVIEASNDRYRVV